jgi:hypothetical protein
MLRAAKTTRLGEGGVAGTFTTASIEAANKAAAKHEKHLATKPGKSKDARDKWNATEKKLRDAIHASYKTKRGFKPTLPKKKKPKKAEKPKTTAAKKKTAGGKKVPSGKPVANKRVKTRTKTKATATKRTVKKATRVKNTAAKKPAKKAAKKATTTTRKTARKSKKK